MRVFVSPVCQGERVRVFVPPVCHSIGPDVMRRVRRVPRNVVILSLCSCARCRMLIGSSWMQLSKPSGVENPNERTPSASHIYQLHAHGAREYVRSHNVVATFHMMRLVIRWNAVMLPISTRQVPSRPCGVREAFAGPASDLLESAAAIIVRRSITSRTFERR